MDLFEKVSEDIKTAMKAKDKVALETLRNVKTPLKSMYSKVARTWQTMSWHK